MALRIAMWSGPRNISTALMRSFGNRSDACVCDEPLYAHYLRETGLQHPGRDEILAAHETDWERVAAWLTGPIPEDRSCFYQKHMAHHLLPGVGRDWLRGLRHAFLIRDPREMLLSLDKVTPMPGPDDTGLPQQLALHDELVARGEAAPILDARDVLENPEGSLRALCDALELDFDPAMLSWSAGPRETDGIWAQHWYDAVERSTGFASWRPRVGTLSDELQEVHEAVLPAYRSLHAQRLRP